MSDDPNLKQLVSGLTKFLEWQDEYDLVRSHLKEGDAAGELMETLGIPRDEIRVLIGGSNSPIFKRAKDEIEQLREGVEGMKEGFSIRLSDVLNEVASVLQMLDELAELWGDEGKFRTCLDRLRKLVTE